MMDEIEQYPTDALLELLFALGEQHQSHISVINNSWGVNSDRLSVALNKNKADKDKIITEVLSRIK